jgi:hypothetical protein
MTKKIGTILLGSVLFVAAICGFVIVNSLASNMGLGKQLGALTGENVTGDNAAPVVGLDIPTNTTEGMPPDAQVGESEIPSYKILSIQVVDDTLNTVIDLGGEQVTVSNFRPESEDYVLQSIQNRIASELAPKPPEPSAEEIAAQEAEAEKAKKQAIVKNQQIASALKNIIGKKEKIDVYEAPSPSPSLSPSLSPSPIPTLSPILETTPIPTPSPILQTTPVPTPEITPAPAEQTPAEESPQPQGTPAPAEESGQSPSPVTDIAPTSTPGPVETPVPAESGVSLFYGIGNPIRQTAATLISGVVNLVKWIFVRQ